MIMATEYAIINIIVIEPLIILKDMNTHPIARMSRINLIIKGEIVTLLHWVKAR